MKYSISKYNIRKSVKDNFAPKTREIISLNQFETRFLKYVKGVSGNFKHINADINNLNKEVRGYLQAKFKMPPITILCLILTSEDHVIKYDPCTRIINFHTSLST